MDGAGPAPQLACPSARSTGTAERVKQDLGGMIHYHGIHLISAAQLSYKPGPPHSTSSRAVGLLRIIAYQLWDPCGDVHNFDLVSMYGVVLANRPKPVAKPLKELPSERRIAAQHAL